MVHSAVCVQYHVDIYTLSIVYMYIQCHVIGQNDHSDPYIESTTVLSDIILYTYIHAHVLYTCCTVRSVHRPLQ